MQMSRYEDVANFLASGFMPPELSSQGKKKFIHESRFYSCNDPYLFQEV